MQMMRDLRRENYPAYWCRASGVKQVGRKPDRRPEPVTSPILIGELIKVGQERAGITARRTKRLFSNRSGLPGESR